MKKGVYKCYQCGNWKPKREIKHNICGQCQKDEVDLDFLITKIREAVDDKRLKTRQDLNTYLEVMVPLLKLDRKIDMRIEFDNYLRKKEKRNNGLL